MWKTKLPHPHVWSFLPPPLFMALLRPILTRSTQIEGGIGLFERCCVHIRGPKVVRMNINTLFGSSELGSPRPTWDPYMTPNTILCRNTPQKSHISCISCILCVYMLFGTLPCSKRVDSVLEVSYGSWGRWWGRGWSGSIWSTHHPPHGPHIWCTNTS
jgi:hypothetical protein